MKKGCLRGTRAACFVCYLYYTAAEKVIVPFFFWGKWFGLCWLRGGEKIFCLTGKGKSKGKGYRKGLNGDSRDRGGMIGMEEPFVAERRLGFGWIGQCRGPSTRCARSG